MEVYSETVFEHEAGHPYYGVSTGERTVKNRLAKLAESHPGECVLLSENRDGSVFYHVPARWVKISPPQKRNLTDEQRAAAAERLKNIIKRHNDN